MGVLLVRDVMTIGVPVCRDTEMCGAVAARLQDSLPVAVVLDKDGRACGWVAQKWLIEKGPACPVGELMDEDIPTVPPDMPVKIAARLMRERGIEHLFLMHNWPGEPRPSAVISRRSIEKVIHEKE